MWTFPKLDPSFLNFWRLFGQSPYWGILLEGNFIYQMNLQPGAALPHRRRGKTSSMSLFPRSIRATTERLSGTVQKQDPACGTWNVGAWPERLIAVSERGGQRRSCGYWSGGAQPRGRSRRFGSVHLAAARKRCAPQSTLCFLASQPCQLPGNRWSSLELAFLSLWITVITSPTPLLSPFLSSKKATSRTARHASLQASGTRKEIQQHNRENFSYALPGHLSLQIPGKNPISSLT